MSLAPLTHHEILGLIEPFTRCGRQVDLAASDRAARRLAFRSRTQTASAKTPQVCSDTLTLDHAEPARPVLQRVLTLDNGMVGRLQVQGADLPELLERIEAVAADRLFRHGPGWCLALHATPPAPTAAGAELLLLSAQVRVADVTLHLKLSAVAGYPAELELTSAAVTQLPDDLLEVLDSAWAPLTRFSKVWRSSLNLRDKEPRRSARALRLLAQAAEHLALTFSQPPAAFHARLSARRWRVAAKRTVPVTVLLALLLAALAVPYLGIAPDSVYWMLIFNAPPLLLVLGFSLRELPRFCLPRSPARLAQTAWPVRPLPGNGPAAASADSAAASLAPGAA